MSITVDLTLEKVIVQSLWYHCTVPLVAGPTTSELGTTLLLGITRQVFGMNSYSVPTCLTRANPAVTKTFPITAADETNEFPDASRICRDPYVQRDDDTTLIGWVYWPTAVSRNAIVNARWTKYIQFRTIFSISRPADRAKTSAYVSNARQCQR